MVPSTGQPYAFSNALSNSETTQISDFNAAYKQKFGFPFIIAVRMYTKEGIFFDFRRHQAAAAGEDASGRLRIGPRARAPGSFTTASLWHCRAAAFSC